MFRGLRFRIQESSFSCLGVFVSVFKNLRFRVYGSAILGLRFNFGVFVFITTNLQLRLYLLRMSSYIILDES